jgi:hypothetical protein
VPWDAAGVVTAFGFVGAAVADVVAVVVAGDVVATVSRVVTDVV